MGIVNTSEVDVTLSVGDMNCMYDEGDEGSNLQVFNNAKLPPGGEVGPQYIEAKASGSCSTDLSYFYIGIAAPADAAGSHFKIVEEGRDYTCEEIAPPGAFDVNIENNREQGGQARITVGVSVS